MEILRALFFFNVSVGTHLADVILVKKASCRI